MAWNRETQDLMAVIMPSTLRGSKIPAEASGSWVVDDFEDQKAVTIRVLTQEQARARKGRGGMAMRVLAVCPKCSTDVAASRLRQHMSRRDHA